jgi:hypothetical protein
MKWPKPTPGNGVSANRHHICKLTDESLLIVRETDVIWNFLNKKLQYNTVYVHVDPLSYAYTMLARFRRFCCPGAYNYAYDYDASIAKLTSFDVCINVLF